MNQHYYFVPVSIEGERSFAYVQVTAKDFARVYEEINKIKSVDRIVSIDVEWEYSGTYHYIRFFNYGYKVKFFYHG